MAAGASTRFGGPKALARLDGRPLLEHVLTAAEAAGLSEIVVVLGVAVGEIESGVEWGSARRTRNPHPERGLASSLQVGLGALQAGTEAALVLLGDQPRVRPDVIRALLAAPADSHRPIVVPRYDRSAGQNPVLLYRAAWRFAHELRGDRGMGPFIAAHPELILEVPVAGENPDVDTPADLEALVTEAIEAKPP
jgi:molybdenum cofactor cytidylyltransferase